MIEQPKELQPVRVLLVDDDVDFITSLQSMLEIEGYEVAAVNDPTAAMGRLREFNPDIALVDLRLGADNGIALTGEMIRLFPDLICVIVTAYSDTDSAIAALQSGVYDYLRKPFEAEELFAVMRRCGEKCRFIREKREVDQALYESDARFRVAFETSPDAIILAELDGIILDANPAFERMSGHRLANVVGKSSLEIGLWKNPQDRTRTIEHLEQYGYVNNIVAEFRMFDGSIRVGLVSARTVTLNGELTVLYVVRDVHDIMAREKALAESEQRYLKLSQEYSVVMDGIPDALMLIDPDLNVVWANKGAGKHFNFSPDAMQGKSCRELWTGVDEVFYTRLKNVLKTGNVSDAKQKTVDGRIWGVKNFPVKNDEGNVVNVIQIASDMTEKTKLREQAARSAHLAAIGELAAGVAHEINNPIGTMLLDLPMLRDVFHDLAPILKESPELHRDQKIAGLPLEKLCEEVPQVVDEVYEGALKIKRIVEELRDFSRPSRGVKELVDLNEVAQKAVRMVRNPLKNATYTFVENYFPDTLYCLGDPHRLEQVVVNLLLNACQALSDKSSEISIETNKNTTGEAIQLVIKDEGCGVDSEILDNITDPFFTTRRGKGGTGLGLSVSSSIISEHRGTLDFQSKPGKGMTVVLELPVSEHGTK